MCVCVCVALCPRKTSLVILGWSVNLSTLFLAGLDPPSSLSVLSGHTFAAALLYVCEGGGGRRNGWVEERP